MQIKTINLPSSERFPCGKRDIKRVLAGIDSLEVTFQHSDMHTPRYARFKFDGTVLANAKTSRHWHCSWFNLFPIGRDQYPQFASEEFQESILPVIRNWFVATLNNQSPETAWKEELFVVWHRGTHELKYINFNY
jgi:hypothetical protein